MGDNFFEGAAGDIYATESAPPHPTIKHFLLSYVTSDVILLASQVHGGRRTELWSTFLSRVGTFVD